MRGAIHQPASRETSIAMSDYARMHTESHVAPVESPSWAYSNAKVRKLIAYRLALTAGEPHVPSDLEGLRRLERQYVFALQACLKSPEIRQHLETVARFGGPLAYFAALIYRRFRLSMDSATLGLLYNVRPSAIRQQLNRLCRIARALFPDADDHLAWHPTATERQVPKLRIRRARKPCGAMPKFDPYRARQLRQAGLSFQQIANHFGLKSRTAVMYALRRLAEKEKQNA